MLTPVLSNWLHTPSLSSTTIDSSDGRDYFFFPVLVPKSFIGIFFVSMILWGQSQPAPPSESEEKKEGAASTAESKSSSEPAPALPDSVKLERIKTQNPVYPPEAERQGIQGQVMVKFVISETGDVESAEAISGDPLLVPAAVAAAKQWKFKPYIKDGRAVKVTTKIPFDFAFSNKVKEIPVPDQPVQLGPGLAQGRLTHQVAPIYPPEAKRQHIQGTVVLKAVIGKDGRLDKLTPISGPTELIGAAVAAVQQWRYKPYLVDGQPVALQTTITVNFVLEHR